MITEALMVSIVAEDPVCHLPPYPLLCAQPCKPLTAGSQRSLCSRTCPELRKGEKEESPGQC